VPIEIPKLNIMAVWDFGNIFGVKMVNKELGELHLCVSFAPGGIEMATS